MQSLIWSTLRSLISSLLITQLRSTSKRVRQWNRTRKIRQLNRQYFREAKKEFRAREEFKARQKSHEEAIPTPPSPQPQARSPATKRGSFRNIWNPNYVIVLGVTLAITAVIVILGRFFFVKIPGDIELPSSRETGIASYLAYLVSLDYVWGGLALVGTIVLSAWLYRVGAAGYVGRMTVRRSFLRSVTTLLVVTVMVGMAYGAYRLLSRPATSVMSGAATPLSGTPLRLSAEVALPIIAKCESGGEQFDEMGDVIENQTTSAIGKYQILEKLHAEEARNLKLNLRSLEGNEAYARILYDKEGFGPWEASRACWEPQLRALGGRLPAVDTIFTVVAERERWTGTYYFPPGMIVDYRAMNPNGRFAMKTQNGTTYTFTPEKSDVVPGAVAEVSFMALGESPENIRIRLYR